MTCSVEKHMIELLHKHAIDFTRPERDQDDPTTLDFYLPAFRCDVEVKQFHTKRITDQLARVPERTTAIVLIGPTAVRDFENLCAALNLPAMAAR